MKSSQNWLNPFTEQPLKKLNNATWLPSSSKMNPVASNVAYVLNDALPEQSRWESTIVNQPSTEVNKDEERDFTAHFRFGGVAFDLQNWNTGYRPETLPVDL